MKRVWFVTLAAGLAVGLATSATWAETPVPTAFTYQGQLKQAGVPLNATADFEFSLWDAAGSGDPPTGGNQVRSTANVTAVNVTNGLFTAELDFGVGAFNGRARWLQIAVRSPTGSGVYTTLAPRQALTAAPYAIATVEPNPQAAPSYAGGLLGVSEFQKCVPEDQTSGNPCDQKVVLSIALVEGLQLVMEVVDPDDPPGVRTRLEILKLPRTGSSTAGAYDVEVQYEAPVESDTFSVGPDHPVYASWNDPVQSHSYWIRATLVSDELLQLIIDPGVVVKVFVSESQAIIFAAHVEPFEPSSRVVQMQVEILNIGQHRAEYVITVTDCGPAVAPIPAQWRTLDPAASIEDLETLTFDVRSSESFVGGEQCNVRLLSRDFRHYDEKQVVFPPPTP